MVYVNSKKFACESCVKGHRSSSCHHTDRPLFEIKKKGRPVSQCQKCRDLRQEKKVHSKCTCNDDDASAARAGTSRTPLGTKSKRFIPIVPALPNGLQDILKTSPISGSLPPDARQRVDSLLNPCLCRSVWKCKCRAPDNLSSKGQRGEDRGFEALVRAAEMFENEASTSAPNAPGPRKVKRISSRPSSPSNNTASHKRRKHVKVLSRLPGPDLPPIFLDTVSSSPTSLPSPIPVFETMPSMSTMTSLAGSGCTCGIQCGCPGCIEHRGPGHASAERKDCADGCGTCVDHSFGLELPNAPTAPSSTSKIFDRFFARAAALPAPPPNRRKGVGVEFDPMDVTVYPDMARTVNNRALAFGLVTVPKLCCGGACSCPEGTCGCGQACYGCCQDHFKERRDLPLAEAPTPAPPVLPAAPIRSCCARKIAATAT